jgi:hypothetical protein
LADPVTNLSARLRMKTDGILLAGFDGRMRSLLPRLEESEADVLVGTPSDLRR